MNSSVENKISLQDPTLPGLQTLLDTKAFGNLLQQNGVKSEITDISPHYIKYKPGVSCLVGYSVTANKQETFVYARTHAEAYAQKLLPKSDDQIFVISELGLTRFTTTNPPIVVYPFPNDHELKSLNRLTDKAWRELLLKRIFPNNPTYWCGNIVPMRYKPERRFVCSVTVDNKPVAVLKFYLSQDFKRAHKTIRGVQKCDRPLVAYKIGVSRKHKILAFNWIEGDSLDSFKQEPEQWHDAGVLVGTSLLDLHNCKAISRPRYKRKFYSKAVRQNAELLKHLNPDLANHFRDVSQRLRDTPRSVLSQKCFVHGDLSLDQLIVKNKQITFIDFDRAGKGDPAIDLGRFIAELHLAVLRRTLSKPQAAAAMNGLLTAYSKNSVSDVYETLPWYTAMSLLLLSLKPFRYCWDEPGQLIAATIQRASDILENGIEID